MKLIELKAKLSEELLETVFHLTNGKSILLESVVFKAMDKTPAYIKKSLALLVQLEILRTSKDTIEITDEYCNRRSEAPRIIINQAIGDFRPVMEYASLVAKGKTELKAAKFLKASLDIENEPASIIRIMNEYRNYLGSDLPDSNQRRSEGIDELVEKCIFWIDHYDHLRYEESETSRQIIERIETRNYKNTAFIDQHRIDSLKVTPSSQFDLSKLIKLCQEINDACRFENYFSVSILVRAVMDHVPPIFGKKSFIEVAKNHGSKSFKDVMCNLENFNRKIADGILHTHIGRKEFLPNFTSVDCRSGIDLLLSEIINELN